MGGTANTPAEAATTSMRYKVDTKNQSYTAGADIYDSSSTGHTVTLLGTAVKSTIQKKIGTHSIKMNGSDFSGTYISPKLTVPAHTDWNVGTSNWTVECWFWPNSTGGSTYRRIFNIQDYAASNSNGNEYINIDYHPTNNTLRAHCATTAAARDIFSATTTSHGITEDAWNHIAFVRNGTSFVVYVGGVSKLTGTSSGSIASGGMLSFGGYASSADGNDWDGYIDEMRFSNSARYTAAFTAFGQDGGTIASPTAFTSDSYTKLLVHGEAQAATGKITRIHGTSLAWK
jgi:hypothetical protein